MEKEYKIVTHNAPHLDEMMGIWLLITFGEAMFPGIAKADVEFWAKMPEGKTGNMLEREGILLIGMGGGRFDEHPTENNGRKQDECAVTLVAKELGIDDMQALQVLFNFVRQRDLHLTGNSFDLHGMTKIMYAAGCDDSVVLQWIFIAMEAIYKVNLEEFFGHAAADFAEAKVENVPIAGGQALRVVSGKSDSTEFAKFARSPHGCRAGVVIQQNSAGNVQIQTNQRFRLNLTDLAQMIRVEENKARKRPVPRSRERGYLGSEGSLVECPEWHFFPEGRMLLNGSTTAKKQPTILPLERIGELVQIGINPQAFEPSRVKECQKGECTSNNQHPCPWYNWHLQRCRKIRFEMGERERKRKNHHVSVAVS